MVTEPDGRRVQALVAGWFWVAVPVALVIGPALAQGRWALVAFGVLLAAPGVVAIAWGQRYP